MFLAVLKYCTVPTELWPFPTHSTHTFTTRTLHLAHRYLSHTHHGTSLWHRLTVAGAHVLCGLSIAVKREWIFSKYDVFVDEMGRMWTGQSPESQRQPFSHSALKIKSPFFRSHIPCLRQSHSNTYKHTYSTHIVPSVTMHFFAKLALVQKLQWTIIYLFIYLLVLCCILALYSSSFIIFYVCSL